MICMHAYVYMYIVYIVYMHIGTFLKAMMRVYVYEYRRCILYDIYMHIYICVYVYRHVRAGGDSLTIECVLSL